MKKNFHFIRSISNWQLILIASMAGGLAEILWVGLYAAFTPLSGASIAREVTASLFPAYAAGLSGVWFGIAIHFVLSIALGIAFACFIWRPFARPRGILTTLAVSVLALAAIWAMNFFVVLPVLNPDFIMLMPYSVTLASKTLFALAMAVTLAWPDLPVTATKPTTKKYLAG